MTPTSITTRPTLSTIVISANAHYNSRTLDELLVSRDDTKSVWVPTVLKSSSQWLSQSSYLGLDDNKHLMYSLTRGEYCLFTAIAITGLAVMGSLLTWLIA